MSSQNSFKINPIYNAVGYFFRNKSIFRIPKYQRSYAWDVEEISAFINDLVNCFNARKSGNPKNHFFGGIVSVEYQIQGTQNLEYEIIDGQQRLVTFTLLVIALINEYESIKETANPTIDSAIIDIINRRVLGFKERFIEYEFEINRIVRKEQVMKLSERDDSHYILIKSNTTPSPTTVQVHSHKLLNKAISDITKVVHDCAEDGSAGSITSKVDNLGVFQQILDADFSILHMITENKDDAYNLFQVLNNRGKSLTEGDLLRARTLEVLEQYPTEQNVVKNVWDEILIDNPSETLKYLKWIFASVQGRSARSNIFYQDFLSNFFPQNTNASILLTDAIKIKDEVVKLKNEIENCRIIIDGRWPFQHQLPVQSWDRNRLHVLMKELKHTLAMPILIAGSKLTHDKFRDLVLLIERFAFRYIYMCKQHATPVGKIYMQEAEKIRIDPSIYNISDLETKLKNLQDSNATDVIFEPALNILQYSTRGGNKYLKYLLINCEYYYRWFNSGASGIPLCMNCVKMQSKK